MTRVLITGGAGFTGRALARLAPVGYHVHVTQRRTPVTGTPAHTVDLADSDAVDDLWMRLRPELVIHTAYTMEAGERDIWMATRNVVDATLRVGGALLHMSTDLVLDGEHAPYAEEAPPAPVHEYGCWKARAEEYVRAQLPEAAIVRTSLITSFEPLDPRSAWVASGLRGEVPLSLFYDEIRAPIFVDDLARQLWEIAALPPSDRGGVWHLAGPEAVSRYALGLLIAARLGLSPERIVPASSRALETPRPRDLRLITARADRMLGTRPVPISALVARPVLASARGTGYDEGL